MNTAAIIPQNQILHSSGENWQGLVVQDYMLSSGTLPENVLDIHHITVNLGTTGTADHKEHGVWKTTLYRTGAIGFVPAGQLYQPRWDFNSHIVTLAVEAGSTPGMELHAQHGVIDKEISGLARILTEEIRYGAHASRLLGQSCALTLQGLIHQKYGTGKSYNKLVYSKLTGVQMSRIIEYCSVSLGENVSLDDLAALCNLSSFHFLRQFKKTTAISPYQFLSRYRIERAKRLLMDEDMSLTVLSNELGYSDQAHFSRSFKQNTGISPSEYKAILKR